MSFDGRGEKFRRPFQRPWESRGQSPLAASAEAESPAAPYGGAVFRNFSLHILTQKGRQRQGVSSGRTGEFWHRKTDDAEASSANLECESRAAESSGSALLPKTGTLELAGAVCRLWRQRRLGRAGPGASGTFLPARPGKFRLCGGSQRALPSGLPPPLKRWTKLLSALRALV